MRSDLTTLFKLVFAYRKPVAEGDIRIASVILRKWLIEGLLGRLCNAEGFEATVPTIDNSEVVAEIANQPSVSYFLTGGVKFNGTPRSGIYTSTIPAQDKPLLPVDRMRDREMKISVFLAQKRLYFEGAFFSCADIIKFAANKLGGAHYDTRREADHEKLNRAAQYFQYGGPQLQSIPSPHCEVYMIFEPKSPEPLSGLYIEIIAAASSFVHLRLDGKPVMKLTTRLSMRTRLRRLFALDKARIVMFGERE